MPGGAVEAIVLRFGLQHRLGKNHGNAGRGVRRQLLHMLHKVLPVGTQGAGALGLPGCPLGHIVRLGDAAGDVQQDIQLQRVKSGSAALGVPLDLLRGQQGATRCLPLSRVTV